MVTVAEAFASTKEFLRSTLQTAKEKLSQKDNEKQTTDSQYTPPLRETVKKGESIPIKLITPIKMPDGLEVDPIQLSQPLRETVKTSSKKVTLIKSPLDVKKTKELEAEKKAELEAELTTQAKRQARKISVKTAVEEQVKFNQELANAFRELDVRVAQGRGARLKIEGGTKTFSPKELAMFVEKQKDIETLKFQSNLERGITDFETVEVPKAVKTTTQTADFLKEAARRTYEKIMSPSGKPFFEYASKDIQKQLPKFTSLEDPGLRQKIGVGLGKGLATVTGVSLIKDDFERAKAESVAIQSVKMATLGILAPYSVPLIPKKTILGQDISLGTNLSLQFAPTFEAPEKQKLRQKIGVGLGKGLAAVTGVYFIEDEIRRGRAEREAIAIVKGASLGFFAPGFEPMTPEESFLRAAGTQAGFQFIVAPIASKVITTAVDIFPKLQDKLSRLPFVTKTKESVTVLQPIKKDVSYDVTFQELSGIRTGTERTAAGTAFAFESSDDVAAGIADRTKIFRIKTGITGKSQIIELGKESALGKITYVGEYQFKLPSPAAYRIFGETGRFPTEFPIVEISKVATFGDIPSELLTEGGDDILKFISGQALTPEKGLDVFFEITKPIEGRGVKGAKDLLSLISPESRGKTFDISYGRIAGSPFEDTSLAIKQIAEKVSLVTQKPLETIISLPKVSAGAATGPIISFATRTVPLDFTSSSTSIYSVLRPVTTGFTTLEKELTSFGIEPSALSIFTGIAPLGIKEVTKSKVKVDTAVGVAVTPAVAVRPLTLQKFAVAQKIGVISKQKLSFATQVAVTPKVALRTLVISPTVQKPTPFKFALKTDIPRTVPSIITTVRPQTFPTNIPNVRPSPTFRPTRLKTPITRRKVKTSSVFIPRPDPITSAITGLQLFGKRGKLKITPEVIRVAKKLKRKGVQRFPTPEILSGKVRITPGGGLVSAYKEFGLSTKKTKRKNRKGVRFI